MEVPSRYLAQQIDEASCVITDRRERESYLLYVARIAQPQANYQIVLAHCTPFEGNEQYAWYSREVFSTVLYCRTPRIVQSMINSMLIYMDEDFELGNPVEFAIHLGGEVNGRNFLVPKPNPKSYI